MTAIRVNYAERKIYLSSAFVKKAFIHGTDEYKALQSVRNDFPDFTLVTRKFKTNTAQEHYRGLGYDFMRDYIRKHEANPEPVLKELDDQIGISKCHSLNKRYPTIKTWFLNRYPEIVKFGMPKSDGKLEEVATTEEVELKKTA